MVTVTSTTPVPAGLSAVMEVSLTTVTSVAGAVPKSTVVPPMKPVPVMVTEEPPDCGPAVGFRLVTVGDEGLVSPHVGRCRAGVAALVGGDGFGARVVGRDARGERRAGRHRAKVGVGPPLDARPPSIGSSPMSMPGPLVGRPVPPDGLLLLIRSYWAVKVGPHRR